MRTKDRICTFGNLIDPRDLRVCTNKLRSDYLRADISIPAISELYMIDIFHTEEIKNIGFILSIFGWFSVQSNSLFTSIGTQIYPSTFFHQYSMNEKPVQRSYPCDFRVVNNTQSGATFSLGLKYVPNDIYREYQDQLDENDMEPDVTV